jgi:hypothetical protein
MILALNIVKYALWYGDGKYDQEQAVKDDPESTQAPQDL